MEDRKETASADRLAQALIMEGQAREIYDRAGEMYELAGVRYVQASRNYRWANRLYCVAGIMLIITSGIVGWLVAYWMFV